MRLRDKVALVVGAGGGMGSAVPYLFAREGAHVVLGARRLEPLEELATRIRLHLTEPGGNVACVTGDATTAAGCEALVRGAIDHFGKLDILYCNVGDAAFGDRAVEEIDDEAWNYLIDVNLTSNFGPVRAAVPELRRTNGCAILVSAAAAVRRAGSPGYAAAKAGLIGLTHSLAGRLKDEGVRVNCICPGSIGPSRADDDFREPPTILNRTAHPADVAYAALYLASDEAAWVTGQAIEVDGGASL
ncbi:MAG: SDR family oxidoreductase [Chloroflexi bacterium]|nr:SDR family oxidoreductase [Chloroflexota bacterium]